MLEKISVFNTLFFINYNFCEQFHLAKVKAKSENYTDDYVFGEKDFFSASDTANDKDMTFTATEDGLYSVRIKTIEGFNNLSIAKDPDGNEIEPYARDYRIGDRTRIDYYQLKKGTGFHD